jgi:hypothetical protein
VLAHRATAYHRRKIAPRSMLRIEKKKKEDVQENPDVLFPQMQF